MRFVKCEGICAKMSGIVCTRAPVFMQSKDTGSSKVRKPSNNIWSILFHDEQKEERVREDNEEKNQCTFQPKLFTKRFNEANGVNPRLGCSFFWVERLWIYICSFNYYFRFSRPQSASNLHSEGIPDHTAKECTFTPQVEWNHNINFRLFSHVHF